MKSLQLYNRITRIVREKRGQGIVEYGIILFVVALVVMLSLSILGERTKALFVDVKF